MNLFKHILNIMSFDSQSMGSRAQVTLFNEPLFKLNTFNE